MSKVICEKEDLVSVADAVRNKTGETSEMTLDEIASEINGIEATGSGSNVETCTVSVISTQLDKEKSLTAFKYMDGSLNSSEKSVVFDSDYAVLKNSLVVVVYDGGTFDYSVNGEVYEYIVTDGILICEVEGDGAITIS